LCVLIKIRILKLSERNYIGGVIYPAVNILYMSKPNVFYKFVIIVATLSLLLVAMAPLFYLIAPPVAVDDLTPAVADETETPESPQ
jgi:hypothetical protein